MTATTPVAIQICGQCRADLTDDVDVSDDEIREAERIFSAGPAWSTYDPSYRAALCKRSARARKRLAQHCSATGCKMRVVHSYRVGGVA